MMEEEQVTATYPCFWTIMSDLVDHPDFDKTDLSRVKLMNANFAVQPPEIGSKMKKALPNAVFVGTFGMTETAGTVTTSRLDATETQRFTRLGTPLSGIEVKAVDPETGEEVPTGERGEAWIRGYCTFSRILQVTGENGRGAGRRWLVPLRRPDLHRRRRAADVSWPAARYAQGRW